MQQETIGDYEVVEPLGSGTVGITYRARHRETGHSAAVKLLRGHVAHDPDIQRRFVREVGIAEKISHPNIVRHYDCGLHEDQIYFAMELVECGTLKEILGRRGILPWREAVECAIQACRALEHAHQAGVIHRDLKPANLFLAEDGKVKVGDFGLARDLNNSRLTMEGQTVGTCLYMPPEQITGEADLTGATDLYALGCILYEMLVGHPPFAGDTTVAVFEQHLNTDPTPPGSLVPDCPEELSKLVLLLLTKDPQERPSSAAAVEAALVDILHGRPMQLVARGEEELAADMAAVADAEAPNLTERLQTGPALETHTISTKRLLVVGGVIVALAVIGYLALR